jgi:hypothetical protein
MGIVNGEGRMKLTFVSSSGIGGVKRAEETWQKDGLQVVKACPSTEIKALMTSAGDCQIDRMLVPGNGDYNRGSDGEGETKRAKVLYRMSAALFRRLRWGVHPD